MPILPENIKKYLGGGLHSKEWQALRHTIGKRSLWVCEGSPRYPDCRAQHGEKHPITGAQVVLTVAHLDHNPENNDFNNLRHWCQRCHNTYDAAHRCETQRQRRAIHDLFDDLKKGESGKDFRRAPK